MRSEVIKKAASFPEPAAIPVRTLMGGFVWAGIALMILSGWFVVTRLGLNHHLRVWDVIALRFGTGAALLSPVLFAGQSKLPRRAWGEGLLLAILWGAPFIVLVAIGIQLTSITLASSIAPALMPVFTGLIGWMAFGEPPTRFRIFGYTSIGIGLLALIGIYALASGAPSLGGVTSLIVAASMWAVYTLRFRRSGLTPFQATALICFWSAIFYLPIYMIFGLSHLADASIHELIFQSLYQGFLMSVVAIVCFNRAVALLGPGAAAAIIALVPVAATVFAIPILNEIPSPASAAAILVIAIGVTLAAGPSQLNKRL